ncbi:Retinoblastoma-related protein [Camellia lanceoleosa]|uniref:Retinoblastoma-related protein n=1 Tax=Camellia lanceoleosa TaxID=1840588 RepID=A0ACC0HUE5_9ERIC|nr:Retinoblastoma-related protein [Camellia lanceoleosa]
MSPLSSIQPWDTLIIKPSKKSPVLFRTIVLIFAMVGGVCICSICIKQSNTHTKTEFLNIEVIERPYPDYDIDKSQISYLHYPKPETFSRSGTGWFETLLNSHMNVSFNREIFYVQERKDNMSSIMQTLDRVYNLDWLINSKLDKRQKQYATDHTQVTEALAHAGLKSSNLIVGIDFTKSNEWTGASQNFGRSKFQLKQAKQLIPSLHRQVTSLTGQLQCLAKDLAEDKAIKRFLVRNIVEQVMLGMSKKRVLLTCGAPTIAIRVYRYWFAFVLYSVKRLSETNADDSSQGTGGDGFTLCQILRVAKLKYA